ncbi:Gamma-aminobutyric acid receptor subunit beta [Fragariocoptes setiger]|uniref:Gamma-aminobutyric acid receptor subunit beta n=1 Tax=Fragariocoptes setiger TaxID=1670756 RepID=A0ABQ7S8F5_9ACAR|nr:Gamma-aminobutyric acid receptor subunit beta [Fragariocoptes setiger]
MASAILNIDYPLCSVSSLLWSVGRNTSFECNSDHTCCVQRVPHQQRKHRHSYQKRQWQQQKHQNQTKCPNINLFTTKAKSNNSQIRTISDDSWKCLLLLLFQRQQRKSISSSVLGLMLTSTLVVVIIVMTTTLLNEQHAVHCYEQQANKTSMVTSVTISRILNSFFDKGYDKRVRPNYGGPPVEVNVTMRILSISSVSEVMMDFTADFYFRQTWHDPRLAFPRRGNIQTLYVGAEVSKKIWLPDTFFGNEKLAYFHEATTPNVFLRIDHLGEVYRSIRLTVTSSCPMNLQYFPMDSQRCTIEAESYGYNVKDIIYKWARAETAVERDEEISLPQFDIIRTEQKYRIEELSSGTYSRLIAEIHFSRRMGYYLIQIYIPSSLIVVISWVSFWLHRNASPARVQLGVTTVLTMTTLMSSTNAALPKISYVKSIDIFLGTCFVMVFAALLEYATVGYLGKRLAMRRMHAHHTQTAQQARAMAQMQAQGAQGEPFTHTGLTSSATPSPTVTGAATHHHHSGTHYGSASGHAHHHHHHHHHHHTSYAMSNADTVGALASSSRALVRVGAAGHHLIPPKSAHLFATTALDDKRLDSIFGVRPSDIDKYSRVVFPVCFVCFQLMYWIVYLHISAFLQKDNLANSPATGSPTPPILPAELTAHSSTTMAPLKPT